MDPLLLLQAEHEIVRALLAMLGDPSRPGVSRKQMLMVRLSEVLQANISVEQQLFLVALKKEEREIERISLVACIERQRAIVHALLPDVADADVESAVFEDRLAVLREHVERLFEEEERLHACVVEHLTSEELNAINEAFNTRVFAKPSEDGSPNRKKRGTQQAES